MLLVLLDVTRASWASGPEAAAPLPAASAPQAPHPARPDPAELEREGAVIGTIRFNIINVFDTSVPAEDRLMYRLVNKLHIKTREQTIRQQLLFAEGEPFVQARLEETERNLRALQFIQDADVAAVSVEDGRVTVLVTTRDDWTTGASVRFGSSGGKSTSGFSLSEGNVLGRGKNLEFDAKNGIDRTTHILKYDDPNVFGTRYHLLAGHQNSTDGKGNTLLFEMPFYSLETRRSYGIDASGNTDQFTFRQEGRSVAHFTHESNDAAVWFGWSPGFQGRVTSRWLLGYGYMEDHFEPKSPLLPGYPDEGNPVDRKDVGPSLEYQWIRSEYIKVKNFDRFARFEDFNLGGSLDLKMQLSTRSQGAAEDEVLFDFNGSQGFRTGTQGWLFTNAGLVGRAGSKEDWFLHLDAAHYFTGWPKQTLVAKFSGDFGVHLDATERFTLGGENGLRGFEVRRFDGERRFLLNVEDRHHWNRLILRLFQLGAAVFVDAGNAWGGVRAVEVCSRQRLSPARGGASPSGALRLAASSCRFVDEDNRFGNVKVDVGIAILADVVRAAQGALVRLNVAYPVNGTRYDQATVLISVGKGGGF